MNTKMMILQPMSHKKIEYKVPIRNHILIRTGTIGDGSCFFHSLLTSISNTYRTADNSQKIIYNQRLRRKLSQQFTEYEWIEFDGMECLLQSQIHQDITQIWKHPNISNHFIDKAYLQYAIHMISQIPYTIIDNQILPRAFDIASKHKHKMSTSSDYVQYIYKYITQYVRIYMSDDKIPANTETLRDLETVHDPHVIHRNKNNYSYTYKHKRTFQTLIRGILDRANKVVFDQFKNQLSSINSWANDFYIKYASKILNINILLLENDTLYKMAYTIDKTKKCVLLYYFEDAHFESVGLYNKKTKNIERSFDYSHPIIQSILH